MNETNVERVWELFAAFNVGDLERAADLAHPELVYLFPGRSPWPGSITVSRATPGSSRRPSG